MTMVIDEIAPPEEGTRAPTPPARPPRGAVVLGALGRALIVAGIVVLLFVVFQLWGTDIQEARAQGGLRDDLATRFDEAKLRLDSLVVATPAPTTPDATAEPEPAPSTTLPALEPGPIDDGLLSLLVPEAGEALAQIEIPSIGVDKIVLQGVAVADLRRGPGHYSQTALPGNPGNAAIAGHRTTYGSPFNRIDELAPGDEITITSVQGEFVYRVLDPLEAYADSLDQIGAVGGGHVIVDPNAAWVLDDFGDNRLTLTACHPKLSSRERIIVAAELVEEPVVLPEWALDVAADAETSEPVSDPTQTVAAAPAPPSVSTSTADPDLDEGLSGERAAIGPASVWMLAALLLWYAGGRLGRRVAAGRGGRIGFRVAGLIPALVCLWFSFELIDRALPAG